MKAVAIGGLVVLVDIDSFLDFDYKVLRKQCNRKRLERVLSSAPANCIEIIQLVLLFL